jgi:hypothetical protein
MVQSIKNFLNAIPHWVLVVLASGAGATVGYLQQQDVGSLFVAMQHMATLKPILMGALGAGVTMIVGQLRREPWLSSGPGDGTTTTTQTVAVVKSETKAEVAPLASKRARLIGWRWVPALGLALLLIGCEALPAVVQDLSNIAQDVIADVRKGGMTALQIVEDVLQKTQTDDAALVVTIIDSLLGDPALAQKNPELVAPLQAVRVAAVGKAAAQHAAKAAQ